MTMRNASHATFTVTRSYRQSQARVFAAWATEDKKSAWFAAPPPRQTLKRSFDFRVGGREQLSTDFGDGIVHHFDAVYREILPGERIIYAYDMHLNETRISVSLATVEFQPEGSGTRLVFTEQAVFLDGVADDGSRRRGTEALIDNLTAYLGDH
ncbi:SRPBCC family protein [Rhizobium halophytocola]|uniref:Uncharacterized protein YndB with AHSA1/START domain n=1 Tax=Rhizobium halophytocola TaxID=735519 RepID=A0ABS4E6B4_9HYPH|nr:SRPBCC family protein [Rhizobium halophytocola]MBP1853486.1 uncharacterized protein YndB with AHSA1/START domain [Rhizobium halophytocola]